MSVSSQSRPRPRSLAVLLALVVAVTGSLFFTATASAAGEETIWGSSAPSTTLDSDTQAVELGTRFAAERDGQVTALRFYKAPGMGGKHTGTLWTQSGNRLAEVTFTNETSSGWQTAKLAQPINVQQGRSYVVSYNVPAGGKYSAVQSFRGESKSPSLSVPTSDAGVYSYNGSFPTSTYRSTQYWVDVQFVPAVTQTSTPTPTQAPTQPSTPAPAVSGEFPSAKNTGVPAGVTLKPYTGPTRITQAGTVIDGALITKPLVIAAGADNVTIRNSLVRANAGFLVLNDEGAKNLQIIDSELDGQRAGGDSAVGGRNYTLTRVNIHSTVDGVKLGTNVTIQDSFIHDLTVSNGSHNDGMQSVGSDNVTIRRNTVIVPDGSTSAIILSTGSASSMRNIQIDNNVLGGGAYTVYGGYQKGADDLSKVSDIKISNNRISTAVNARGGVYGPFISVDSPAVSLTNNVWHDGPNAGKAV